MSDVLYRTETAYGSQERGIQEVISFEIFELGNTDIPQYLLTHHKNCFPEATIQWLELLADEQKVNELLEEEVHLIVENIIYCLNRHYHVNLKYCLWLSSREVVKDLYGGTDETIDAYNTSSFILSDLGQDGKLFAYEHLPQRLNSRIFLRKL